MREFIFKKQFSKDVERIKRAGRDMSHLAEAIDLLAEGKPMPPNNRDHPLIGNFKDYRECHLGGTGCFFIKSPAEPSSWSAQAVTRTFSTSENQRNRLSLAARSRYPSAWKAACVSTTPGPSKPSSQ